MHYFFSPEGAKYSSPGQRPGLCVKNPHPTLPRIAGEGQGVGVVIKTWDVASGSPISALQPGIKMITGEICRLR